MKKGFTLIELLAVIVILAVIALIAIPIISNVIEKARKSAFRDSAYGYIDSTRIYAMQPNILYDSNNQIVFTCDGNSCHDKDNNILLFKGEKPISGTIVMNRNGDTKLTSVTNGKYCATGTQNMLAVDKDCVLVDDTNPVINVSKLVISVTTNSATITLADDFSTDEESGIKSYKYEIFKNDKLINTIDSIDKKVKFTELENDTEYTIKVTAINGNNLTSDTSVKVKTNDINVPTYAINKTGWATSKIVTITYPTGEPEFVYSYSTDEGTNWTTVASGTTQTVPFNENGSVIARVYDGTNYKTASSYTVTEIDRTSPTVSYSIATGTYDKTTSVKITGADTSSYASMLVHVYKNNVLQYEINNTNTVNSVNMTTGVWTIYTQVFDSAGNKQNQTPNNGDWYYQTYTIREYSQSSACGYAACATSACGVASYKTCATSACGVAAWNTCSTSACGSYQTCTSTPYACMSEYCGCAGPASPPCSPYGYAVCTGRDPRCVTTSCTTNYYSCATSACGVAAYNSCATSACGVASYKTCSTSACGYATCWHS